MALIIRSFHHYWIPTLLCLCLAINSVQAGMISTHQIDGIVDLENHERAIIHTALQREDVRNALLEHGVDPTHVEQRLNQLTDQEIQQLANRFDELPAASGVGAVLFATGPIVFMLELMGLTDLTTTF